MEPSERVQQVLCVNKPRVIEGSHTEKDKDLTEATLFLCHLLLGIVRISTALNASRSSG